MKFINLDNLRHYHSLIKGLLSKVDSQLEKIGTNVTEIAYRYDGYMISPNEMSLLLKPKDGEYFIIVRNLDKESSGKVNHYYIRFTYPEDCPGVIFQNWEITWYGGDIPTWTAGNTYEISIVDNIALFAEFEPAV